MKWLHLRVESMSAADSLRWVHPEKNAGSVPGQVHRLQPQLVRMHWQRMRWTRAHVRSIRMPKDSLQQRSGRGDGWVESLLLSVAAVCSWIGRSTNSGRAHHRCTWCLRV
eukprot:9075925-Karenia_brevis.AAC.1